MHCFNERAKEGKENMVEGRDPESSKCLVWRSGPELNAEGPGCSGTAKGRIGGREKKDVRV
ncbi:coiled-coil domain-containing protein 117-like protein [Anopheles sinensis]|uniref:Coiled-coil domain-containing protein 117-like protein n=1 Tax=Anopheles sinensis TaxID=74873 RepID=A0A084VYZ3_ANOSI|nr:coiled-coil domain-containing protein 117-like protein [Anopheles sinensis]